ncbi:arsenate reductase ArsC [Streptomyces sp. NPDC002896]|uniref:arsenate reductase ArsC n=1 Tax=Streptomyces sp. NPDC002896 TaxID=3154438 RepID=UPI00332C94E4
MVGSSPSAPLASVLFVCVHNAGRSQMAAGFLDHLAGDRIEVRSAGSIPGDQVNPAAAEAMKEVGIDISSATPRILTTEAVQASDHVITVGCGDACPISIGIERRPAQPDRTKALAENQIAALWRLDVPLREKTPWKMLYDPVPAGQAREDHRQGRGD